MKKRVQKDEQKNEEVRKYSSIDLEFNDKTDELIASMNYKDSTTPTTQNDFINLLIESGYDRLMWLHQNIDELFQYVNSNLEPPNDVVIQIAKRKHDHSSFTLDFDTDSEALVATVIFKDSDEPSTKETLMSAIHDEGYADYFVVEKNIEKFMEHLQTDIKPVKPFKIDIAKKIHAIPSIKLSKDGMEAMLTIKRNWGGEYVNKEQIKQLIMENNIVKGLFPHIYDIALASEDKVKEQGEISWVLAKGKAPVDGTDTEFVPKYKAMLDRRKHQFDDEGRARYRDKGAIKGVQMGDVVMEATLPTKGVDGYTVTGETLKANDGEQLDFVDELPGVERCSENTRHLRAVIDGLPIVVERGVVVEKFYEVEEVNLETGHIEFDGTVYVRGRVKSGMKVIASGDIIVDEMVEASYLQAGNDVTVNARVIGRPTPSSDINENVSKESNDWKMCIEAKGKVTLLACVNCYVYSHNGIHIQQLSRHSCLISNTYINVGDSDSEPGIIGGYTLAIESVTASNIGSKGNVRTFVEVGRNPMVVSQQEESLNKEITKRTEAIDVLTENISALKNATDEKKVSFKQRLENTILQYQDEIKQYKRELKKHIAYLKEVTLGSFIEASGNFYPGITVTVNGQKRNITNLSMPGKFFAKEGSVVFSVEEDEE